MSLNDAAEIAEIQSSKVSEAIDLLVEFAPYADNMLGKMVIQINRGFNFSPSLSNTTCHRR